VVSGGVMHPARRFVGTWELVASLSRYESGAPPKSGIYRIEPEANGLHFTIDWVDADDKAQHVAHTLEFDETGDVTLRLIDGSTLDTEVKREGAMTLHARRVLSEDGSSMTITQSGTSAEGEPFSNVASYRRTDRAGGAS